MKHPLDTWGDVVVPPPAEPDLLRVRVEEEGGGFLVLVTQPSGAFDRWLESEADVVDYLGSMTVRWEGGAAVEEPGAPRGRLLVTRPLSRLSPALVTQLEAVQRARRALGRPDDVEVAFGAFLLDPGMGPAAYLDRSGRILWDPGRWEVAGTRAEAFAALVAGARKTGIAALRSLLPRRDAASTDCSACGGTGLLPAGRLRGVHGEASRTRCAPCAGLGWTSPRHPLGECVLDAASEARVRGAASAGGGPP